MNAPLRRAAVVVVSLFAILAISATYLQAVAGPEYRDDPRNPRLVQWRIGRERGTIVTRDAVIVARSDPDPADPQVFQRTYPEGETYSHVVGYTSVLFGTAGLEQVRSNDLVSDRGSTISGVLNSVLGGDPRARGLRMTLDAALQNKARELLGNQNGAIVALDPRTGEALAMVSSPGFDPNGLVGPGAGPTGDELAADPRQPLLNRSIEEVYAPGSTFKIITAAAALENGLAGPSTQFDDPVELQLPATSSTIENADGRACVDGVSVSFETAFVRSCNTIFAALGMEIGAEDLVETAEAFGFNEAVPFDLEVVASRIPTPEELLGDDVALAQTAIGGRDVRSTPLEMALTAAAVANEGRIMVPYVVGDVFLSDGTVESSTEPVIWRRAISPATAAVLGDLMERVVISGTGTRAAVPGVRVAGKTGTARVTGAPPHVWFTGFAPVDADPNDPQIAVAVLIESGGNFGESATGGSVAAPIAAALFEEYLR